MIVDARTSHKARTDPRGSGHPEWVPNFDAVANLVYSADGASVDTVLVEGEVLIRGGRLTNIDERALYAEARAVAERVVARAGLRSKRVDRWPLVRG
jgi:5-methylthioadenosine/S-adenosylhomocysteine deaminase